MTIGYEVPSGGLKGKLARFRGEGYSWHGRVIRQSPTSRSLNQQRSAGNSAAGIFAAATRILSRTGRVVKKSTRLHAIPAGARGRAPRRDSATGRSTAPDRAGESSRGLRTGDTSDRWPHPAIPPTG